MQGAYRLKSLKLHILSSRSIKLEHISAIKSALRVNYRFFGFKLPCVKVVVCHTPEEWRKNSKYYYFEFARGLVLRDGTVVVKSPTFAKISLSSWQRIVTHELNHVYWIHLHPRGRDLWAPIWLLEGLACHVARNDILLSPRRLRSMLRRDGRIHQLTYRYRASLFKTRDDVRLQYSLWCYFVDWLVEKNKTALRGLIRDLPTCTSLEKFNCFFRKRCGESAEELFSQYLREQKFL